MKLFSEKKTKFNILNLVNLKSELFQYSAYYTVSLTINLYVCMYIHIYIQYIVYIYIYMCMYMYMCVCVYIENAVAGKITELWVAVFWATFIMYRGRPMCIQTNKNENRSFY